MKFSNGCWLQKEGVACFPPAEVFYSRVEKDRVVITAPTSHINHRGDTLGGINLTIEITAPIPDVLRVKVSHYLGVQDKMPKFELENISSGKMSVDETEEYISVSSGSLRIEIGKRIFISNISEVTSL